MKQIYLLFGIMMVLALCITPVAAVSADDFEIVTMKDGEYTNYEYHNVNNPVEEYTMITPGNIKCGWRSFVTFKPANIEGAPVMVVDTWNKEAHIYLPRSVDEWEIKYYHGDSYGLAISYLDEKYLKNAGVVNLNEVFGDHVKDGLWLEIFYGLHIESHNNPTPIYRIPEVKNPPVVPVSADLFEVDIVDVGGHDVYDYRNVIDPNDGTFWIWTGGTHWLNSYVTFKPVGIKGAPVMVVDTWNKEAHIYLPRSVDEWEIKYYHGDSCGLAISYLDEKYLKNAGVVNLKKFFGKGIWNGLELELSSWDQKIVCPYPGYRSLIYYIPEVK